MDNLILFLDIDGILHPAGAEPTSERCGGPIALEDIRVGIVRGTIRPSDLGLLCIGQQRLLADVLNRYPELVVVISSSWGYWEGYNFLAGEAPDADWENRHVTTLDWLKRWLVPDVGNRIVGRTGLDDAAPLQASRLDHIRHFMRERGAAYGATRWIALDDQVRHFPADRITPFYRQANGRGTYDPRSAADEILLLIDGRTGLTTASAIALEHAIRHAKRDGSRRSVPTERRNLDACGDALSRSDSVRRRIK